MPQKLRDLFHGFGFFLAKGFLDRQIFIRGNSFDANQFQVWIIVLCIRVYDLTNLKAPNRIHNNIAIP